VTFRSAIPVVFGLLITACAPEAEQAAEEMAEATTQEYESAGSLIATLESNYEEHYNLGHASMVADLYADDAIVMNANSAVNKGRDAITASLEEFITTFSPVLTINPAEQVMVGDWVVDRGSYTQEISPEGGDAVTLSGYYMSLSQRTEEGLRLHRLAVNSDGPPPIPMPGPEMVETEAMSGGPLADLIALYAEHYNMGHESMVSDLYTEDGVSMFAEAPASNGRAAIEAAIAERMGEGSPQLTIMDAETVMLGEGWAVDRGHYTVEATVEGQSVTQSGTYMSLCREMDDGSWKLHWGLTNAVPMPAI
jgi:ketosteroid isomerase-like protein